MNWQQQIEAQIALMRDSGVAASTWADTMQALLDENERLHKEHDCILDDMDDLRESLRLHDKAAELSMAENERLQREVDEREKLIVDNACQKAEIERLKTCIQEQHDEWEAHSGVLAQEVECLRNNERILMNRIKGREAEIERLRHEIDVQCSSEYVERILKENERLRELTENDGKEIGSYREGTGLRGENQRLRAALADSCDENRLLVLEEGAWSTDTCPLAGKLDAEIERLRNDVQEAHDKTAEVRTAWKHLADENERLTELYAKSTVERVQQDEVIERLQAAIEECAIADTAEAANRIAREALKDG